MVDVRPPALRDRIANRLSINYSLLGTLQALALHPLFIDTHDYRGTVILAGSGRSGTTWVQDIINYRNEYRILSEPFHPGKVGIVRHFNYGQYLRPNNRDPKYLEPAAAILSGRVRGYWIDKFNQKRIARRRLVKEIHVHQLLKWIKTNFPEIPMLLLLRHPCAVAHSNLQLRFETHLDHLLTQTDLVEDFLEPYRRDMENASTQFEKYIFMWCADNYVPLKQFAPGEIEIVFYENLCVKPEEEIKRIFAFLGESYDSRVLQTARMPSQLARKSSAVMVGESLTDSWRKGLTRDQIQTAMEILHLFGLDRIYGEESLPLTWDGSSTLAALNGS